jgi:putative acetyltransferase
MQNQTIEIVKYKNQYRKQLLDVWEKSVLATHDFLSREDFTAIKETVQTIDFNSLDVYCVVLSETVLGFIGVADAKVEMLFIGPEYFGQGLGSRLMSFAISALKANKVDVNEQNINAVKFYRKLGFEIFERTEKDDQGKNYPLLRMKLGK